MHNTAASELATCERGTEPCWSIGAHSNDPCVVPDDPVMSVPFTVSEPTPLSVSASLSTAGPHAASRQTTTTERGRRTPQHRMSIRGARDRARYENMSCLRCDRVRRISGSATLSSGASVEQRLTAEILALDRGTKTQVVQDVAAIGERINVPRQVRHRAAGLDALADQLGAHADVLPEAEVGDTVMALAAVLAEVRGLLPE